MEFTPDRYLKDNPAAGEKFAYVPFGAGKREPNILHIQSLVSKANSRQESILLNTFSEVDFFCWFCWFLKIELCLKSLINNSILQ